MIARSFRRHDLLVERHIFRAENGRRGRLAGSRWGTWQRGRGHKVRGGRHGGLSQRAGGDQQESCQGKESANNFKPFEAADKLSVLLLRVAISWQAEYAHFFPYRL
jgi:hypothetical protein